MYSSYQECITPTKGTAYNGSDKSSYKRAPNAPEVFNTPSAVDLFSGGKLSPMKEKIPLVASLSIPVSALVKASSK